MNVARSKYGETNAILVRKPLAALSFGRARISWEDNIKVNLRYKGCEVGRWMELAGGRVQWRALVY
jgi:hypothetical protein